MSLNDGYLKLDESPWTFCLVNLQSWYRCVDSWLLSTNFNQTYIKKNVSARCMVAVRKTFDFVFTKRHFEGWKIPASPPETPPRLPSQPIISTTSHVSKTEVMDRMSHNVKMNLLIQSIEGWGSWETWKTCRQQLAGKMIWYDNDSNSYIYIFLFFLNFSVVIYWYVWSFVQI